MFISSIVIALLTSALSYRQSPYCVTAFVRSSLSANRLSICLNTVEDDEQQENDSRERLLDESILLYAQVSQRLCVDDKTQVEKDILELREKELTSLIEDAVFDARGLACNDFEAEEPKGVAISVQNNEKKKELQSFDEISQALDQQILLGYQSTFSEDELGEWVGRIDVLFEKMQTQISALPPASSTPSEETTVDAKPKEAVTAPESTLERLHRRLESMRTLIDPEGSGRLRLPLAQLVTAPKASFQNTSVVKSVSSPSPPPETSILAEQKVENENCVIETRSKQSTTEDASTKVQTKDSIVEQSSNATIICNRNDSEDNSGLAKLESVETSEVALETEKEDGILSTADMDKKIEEILVENNQKEKSVKKQNALLNATATSINSTSVKTKDQSEAGQGVGVEKSSNATTSTKNATDAGGFTMDTHTNATDNFTTSMVPSDEVSNYENDVELDGTDVISTVVTTAALGAAAVTKLPLFVAGVALGPVIRDSISYAKGRMDASKAAKNANETFPEGEDESDDGGGTLSEGDDASQSEEKGIDDKYKKGDDVDEETCTGDDGKSDSEENDEDDNEKAGDEDDEAMLSKDDDESDPE